MSREELLIAAGITAGVWVFFGAANALATMAILGLLYAAVDSDF